MTMSKLQRFKDHFAPDKSLYPGQIKERSMDILSCRDAEIVAESGTYYVNIETSQCLIKLKNAWKSQYPDSVIINQAERWKNTFRVELGICDFWTVRNDEFHIIMRQLRHGNKFNPENTSLF